MRLIVLIAFAFLYLNASATNEENLDENSNDTALTSAIKELPNDVEQFLGDDPSSIPKLTLRIPNQTADFEIIPGKEYPLRNVIVQPYIQFSEAKSADSETVGLYTFIMIDYDVPERVKPAFLHELVVNIPGSLLKNEEKLTYTSSSPDTGLILATYVPPAPPFPNRFIIDNSEIHRYVFLLFEQTHPIALPIGGYREKWFNDKRANFDLIAFAKQNHLKGPVSAFNFFKTEKLEEKTAS